MFNPFYIYIYSFLAAFILYFLDFSTIYPTLSFETTLFFVISFIVAGFIGFRLTKQDKFEITKVSYDKTLIYITIGVLVAHIIEFIYTGQLPIAGIGTYKDYTGIPTLHVLIYTFNIFFAVYVFNVLISEKNKLVPIVLFIANVIPSFLIMSRGMLVNIVIGCLFVLLYTYGNTALFYKKQLWKIVVAGIAGLYLFGVSGNIRNNTINGDPEIFHSKYIMEVGGASTTFRESWIPKEFFWGYIYISSPLANFEQVVQTHQPEITVDSVKKYLANELATDFIAKRIFKADYNPEKEMEQITPSLTVGTGFRGAYYYLGWTGVIVSFSVLMTLAYGYIKLLSNNNPFRIVGIAMLANLVALFAFDNMIIYSGMSFQLIYPLVWEVYLRTKDPLKRKLMQYKKVNI